MLFRSRSNGSGDVSSFQALCTALAATVGTGNIVGVATAVKAGGPGALFWMWIAAFFGMATKYAEGVLAVKYRKVDDNGNISGGPMYYIEQGLGKKYKPLAVMFAIFGEILNSPAPSIRPASISSSESTEAMYCRINKTVAELAMAGIINGMKLSKRWIRAMNR